MPHICLTSLDKNSHKFIFTAEDFVWGEDMPCSRSFPQRLACMVLNLNIEGKFPYILPLGVNNHKHEILLQYHRVYRS